MEHPRDRPIEEQVAVLRHDIEGIKQNVALLAEMQKRQVVRTDAMEASQLIVNDTLRAAWKEDFRALYYELSEAEQEKRREDIKNAVREVFGKAKLAVLYLVPFLTALNVIGQWLDWW